MKKEIELQPATKLTVIIDSDKKYGPRRLYRVVQDALLRYDINGFTMTKGSESFGSSRVIHSSRGEMASNLPLVFEAIDEERKIRKAAEIIAEMLGAEGLVQIQPTRVLPPKWLISRETFENAG